MKRSDAQRIVGYLCAAYPNQALEEESVAVYVSAVEKLKDPHAALLVAEAIVKDQPKFPAIADLVRDYKAQIQRWNEIEPKPVDAPALEAGPRQLPQVVLEHLDKLAGTDSEAERLSGFEDAGAGRCEECGTEGPLLVYVLLRLCRRCVVRRLRAAEKVNAA